MNRKEFIESCRDLSEAELLHIAIRARNMAEKRVPPEMTALFRTLDDVTRQGEIEGLTFDEDAGQLLVLYNRGARIVLGMPKGFYEGYDREISEVFQYEIGK